MRLRRESRLSLPEITERRQPLGIERQADTDHRPTATLAGLSNQCASSYWGRQKGGQKFD